MVVEGCRTRIGRSFGRVYPGHCPGRHRGRDHRHRFQRTREGERCNEGWEGCWSQTVHFYRVRPTHGPWGHGRYLVDRDALERLVQGICFPCSKIVRGVLKMSPMSPTPSCIKVAYNSRNNRSERCVPAEIVTILDTATRTTPQVGRSDSLSRETDGVDIRDPSVL